MRCAAVSDDLALSNIDIMAAAGGGGAMKPDPDAKFAYEDDDEAAAAPVPVRGKRARDEPSDADDESSSDTKRSATTDFVRAQDQWLQALESGRRHPAPLVPDELKDLPVSAPTRAFREITVQALDKRVELVAANGGLGPRVKFCLMKVFGASAEDTFHRPICAGDPEAARYALDVLKREQPTFTVTAKHWEGITTLRTECLELLRVNHTATAENSLPTTTINKYFASCDLPRSHDVFDWLFEHRGALGININTELNSTNKPLLVKAAEANDMYVVNKLLAAEGIMNLGWAFAEATGWNHLEVARRVWDRLPGEALLAWDDSACLRWAAKHGHVGAVEMLIQLDKHHGHGALNYAAQENFAVGEAVKGGRLDVLQKLWQVHLEADPDTPASKISFTSKHADGWGVPRTPFELAVLKQLQPVAKFLWSLVTEFGLSIEIPKELEIIRNGRETLTRSDIMRWVEGK